MNASTWRIPLSAMLSLVAFAALACAALMSASTLWAQVVATLTFTALLIATIGACESAHRAFWRGFAIFGWVYLVLSTGPWFVEQVRPVLLSQRILEEVYVRTADDRGVKIAVENDFHPFLGPFAFSKWEPDYVRFHSIGHHLFCLVHAVFGGLVASFFAARRQAHPTRTEPTAQPAAPVDPDDETTRN